MEHGGVPPQMVAEVVRSLPVSLQAIDPGDALAAPALHFHDVRDAVGCPKIAGIAVDRRAPRCLGFGVIAAFLVREAAAAEDGAVTGKVIAPMAFDAEHGGQHQVRASEPEVDEMGQAESQHVTRMIDEDLFPHRGGVIRVAIDPVQQRRDMRTLARRCVCGEALRIRRRHFRHRQRSTLVRQHGEVALQAMGEAEVGVGLEQRLHALRQIRAIADVADQRMVESLHRSCRRRRDLQPMGIPMHRSSPLAC